MTWYEFTILGRKVYRFFLFFGSVNTRRRIRDSGYMRQDSRQESSFSCWDSKSCYLKTWFRCTSFEFLLLNAWLQKGGLTFFHITLIPQYLHTLLPLIHNPTCNSGEYSQLRITGPHFINGHHICSGTHIRDIGIVFPTSMISRVAVIMVSSSPLWTRSTSSGPCMIIPCLCVPLFSRKEIPSGPGYCYSGFR